MKYILILALSFLTPNVMAQDAVGVWESMFRDASVTAVPGAFGDAGGILLAPSTVKRNIGGYNLMGGDIEICWDANVAAECTSDKILMVPDGRGFGIPNVRVGGKVFVQMKSGSPDGTGEISGGVW